MDFKLIFGIVGNFISIILFASPLRTFLNIYKNKSAQEFSAVPYVITLLNCLLWVLYGLPFITESAVLLLTINAAGCIFQIYYLMMYLTYASSKPRRKAFKLLAACTGLYVVVVVLTVTAVPKKDRSRVVGLICVVLNAGMYASPLSIMRLVIRTRSVQFMPFLLSFFMFLNSVTWAGYGFFTKDINVLIPNGLGVLASTAQLVLYAIYRNANDKSKAFDQKGDDAIKEGPVKSNGSTPNPTPNRQKRDDIYRIEDASIKSNGSTPNRTPNRQKQDEINNLKIEDASAKSNGSPSSRQKRDDATPKEAAKEGPVKQQTDHHVSIPINKIEDASVKSDGNSPNRQKRDDATPKEAPNMSPVTQRTDHHISIPIEKKVGEKTTESIVSEQQ